MFRFAASSLPVTLRQMGLVAMACSIAALSACGGGSRAKAYAPDRVVSFGDENSMIDSFTSANLLNSTGSAQTTLRGLTYTVNPVVASTSYCALGGGTVGGGSTVACSSNDSTVDSSTFDSTTGVSKGVVLDSNSPNVVTLITTGLATISSTASQPAKKSLVTGYNCAVSSIWIQVIAHNFGKGFSTKCPLDVGGAETYAAKDARVADVANQVNANIGQLGKGVLVTIMAGQHDILDLFDQVTVAHTKSEADATQELLGRASTLANVVRQVISTGAKVVLAQTPDLGESPKAYGLSATDRDILKRMTDAFNKKLYISEMGTSVAGRDVAGVPSDSYTNQTLRVAGVDYTNQACNKAAVTRPDGASASSTTTYIWADDTHVTPYIHGQMGLAGANRAFNQLTVD